MESVQESIVEMLAEIKDLIDEGLIDAETVDEMIEDILG